MNQNLHSSEVQLLDILAEGTFIIIHQFLYAFIKIRWCFNTPPKLSLFWINIMTFQFALLWKYGWDSQLLFQIHDNLNYSRQDYSLFINLLGKEPSGSYLQFLQIMFQHLLISVTVNSYFLFVFLRACLYESLPLLQQILDIFCRTVLLQKAVT